MANTIQIQLLTEIDQSLKNIDRFTSKAVDNINQISTGFQDLKQSVPTDVFKGAFGAGLAIKGLELLKSTFEDVVSVLSHGIDAAAKEEAALSALTEALRANGQASQENISAATAFAEQLERTTKFSSDAVLGAEQLLASLTGLSGEGLNQATQAAADLSTVLGIDLETAARKLAKATQGGDEQFAKLGLRFVKGATDAQTFQNILGAVSSQLGGRAQAAAQTFSGALAITSNAVENVVKAFGNFIIKSPVVIAAFQTISNIANQLVDSIQANASVFKGFIDSFITGFASAVIDVVSFGKAILNLAPIFASSFSPMVDGLNLIFSALGKLVSDVSIKDFFYVLGKVALYFNAALGFVVQGVKAVGSAFISIISPLALAINRLISFTELLSSGKLEQAKSVFTGFGDEIKASFLEPLADSEKGVKSVFDTFSSGSDKLEKDLKQAGTAAANTKKEFLDLTKSIGAGKIAKQITVSIKAEAPGFFDSFLNKFSSFFKAFDPFFNELDMQMKTFFASTGPEAIKAGMGIGKSIGSAIAQGAQGVQVLFGKAVDAVADIASKVAQAAGPIAGIAIGIVAELLKFFAQGKEAVQAQTRAFLTALQALPKTIMESIPVFVSELLRSIAFSFPAEFARLAPTLITSMINELSAQLPTLIPALANSMVQSALALQLMMPRIAIALILGIVANLPQFMRAFIQLWRLNAAVIAVTLAIELGKQAPYIARETAAAFVEEFKNAARSIGNIGGSVSNAAQSVGGFVGGLFGFADGGRVPDSSQFANDGGLARVSSGEQILNKDLSGELQSFLQSAKRGGSTGGGSQMLTINLMVGERELANVLLNLNNQGFRIS